jgi:hypothetical protein
MEILILNSQVYLSKLQLQGIHLPQASAGKNLCSFPFETEIFYYNYEKAALLRSNS